VTASAPTAASSPSANSACAPAPRPLADVHLQVLREPVCKPRPGTQPADFQRAAGAGLSVSRSGCCRSRAACWLTQRARTMCGSCREACALLHVAGCRAGAGAGVLGWGGLGRACARLSQLGAAQQQPRVAHGAAQRGLQRRRRIHAHHLRRASALTLRLGCQSLKREVQPATAAQAAHRSNLRQCLSEPASSQRASARPAPRAWRACSGPPARGSAPLSASASSAAAPSPAASTSSRPSAVALACAAPAAARPSAPQP